MNFQQNQSHQKTLFLIGITAIYLVIVTWLDFLQGPAWWDEADFWKSSLTFSDSLLPSLSDLRGGTTASTPRCPSWPLGCWSTCFSKAWWQADC